jgi:hypothetical protein
LIIQHNGIITKIATSLPENDKIVARLMEKIENWYFANQKKVLFGSVAFSVVADVLFFVFAPLKAGEKLGDRAIAAVVAVAILGVLTHLDRESTVKALASNPELIIESHPELVDFEFPTDEAAIREEFKKRNLSIITFTNDELGTSFVVRENSLIYLVGIFPGLLLPMAIEKISAIKANRGNAEK